MATVKAKGLDKVKKNLIAEIAKIKGATRRGMIKAGVVLKGASIRNSPVDLGNLRASHYVYFSGAFTSKPAYKETSGDDAQKLLGSHESEIARAKQEVKGMQVRVGASAFYSLFVHEAPPSTTFSVGGSKFLQKAVSENQGTILKIISDEARIPQ